MSLLSLDEMPTPDLYNLPSRGDPVPEFALRVRQTELIIHRTAIQD